ncbi:MAG: DUF2007 domain-containing protein [Candidatus Krumholzibacteriota bacterium]|nr:DUF2007 domain-containing protein [Candidatus Krumholzibacteriota bacterium]
MEPKQHDEEKLVELVSVQGEIEAKIIYGILEAEGIRTLIKSNMAGGALPFTADGMGNIKLFVTEDDLAKAGEIIREYRKTT